MNIDNKSRNQCEYDFYTCNPVTCFLIVKIVFIFLILVPRMKYQINFQVNETKIGLSQNKSRLHRLQIIKSKICLFALQVL